MSVIVASYLATGDDPPPLPGAVPQTLHALAAWLQELIDQTKSIILLCFDDIGFHPDLTDEIEDFMLTAPADVEIVAATTAGIGRSEEHTYELQSLMRTSYAVFCLKK